MMTVKPHDWQKLNAYVDGELEPREAADVALAAGLDSATADQISLLYHLKGGAHEALSSAPADLVAMLPSRRTWHMPAIAAAIIVMLLGAGGLAAFGAMHASWPLAHGDLFASARTLHRQWIVSDVSSGVDTPPMVLAAVAQFGHLPMVPDLESTGLSVVLVSVTDQADGRLLQVGYRGQHGCHLSLFVFSGDQLPALNRGDLDTAERAHIWRVNDLGYLLFAKGMDNSRFDLIAEKVEHATRVKAPLDGRAKQELARNKQDSASCQA